MYMYGMCVYTLYAQMAFQCKCPVLILVALFPGFFTFRRNVIKLGNEARFLAREFQVPMGTYTGQCVPVKM